MTRELDPPQLIQAQRQLDALVDVLQGESVIAVDTEADSFFSYREKVCLIQITAGEEDYLVDPLAPVDLGGLGPVFADPGTTKIFHDGEYDVLILGREHGFRFAGLYDTRIAASALGSKNPGLASVLEEHFDIVLDKSMQRSNWGERPLSERQIDYARLDTHYLHELMEQQVVELDRRDRRMIVDGECRRLEGLEAQPLQFNPDEWVRLKGARTLSPEGRSALRELFLLRDELANAADVPPFRVMNNQAMVNAAAERPRSAQALADVQGFSWRQVRKIGDEVLEAFERAAEAGPLKLLPRLPPKDGTGGLEPEQVELHDRLKAWRRDRATDEELDASLVLNRHALVELVREQPRDAAALGRVDGVLDWQVERYGDEVLEVLSRFRADLKAGRVEPPRRRGGQRQRK